MRFTLVTYGSEGDTRPFVALARGLLDAGHEVIFFGERSSIGIANSHAVSAHVLAGDVSEALPLANSMQELTTKEVIGVFKRVRDVVNGNTDSWMKAISEHARGSDAVMFAGLAYFQGQAIAQALGKPRIGLWLQPAAPTTQFSSWALPPMRLPGLLNRFSYVASLHRVLKNSYGKEVDSSRKKIFGNSGKDKYKGRELTLYGFSPHLIQPPNDWPLDHHVCGHWDLASGQWKAPAALIEFLAAGPPPIYVGLGAASSFTRQSTLTKIVSAVNGRRALFYPGWSKIDATMLPDNFNVIGHTPHNWLFQKVSVVVHHCGAGTTHAAARGGVPSVALPLGGDQLHWANALARAGVAAKYVNRRRLDAPKLQEMIEFSLRPDVRHCAKTLGSKMAMDNGVRNAVEAIERHLASV
jgi:UDP:flavonoid glycosyltransferase YjiC (YdhE family)